MEKLLKRISSVFILLSLCWMSTIFFFSSRNADESKQDSLSVGIIVGQTFVSDFESWDTNTKFEFAEKIDHPIRKIAHASEYAILGILIFLIQKEPNKNWFWIAWFICILYASSDEFHQIFVPGRSGQMSDVCLDSCGAFIGICMASILKKLKQR